MLLENIPLKLVSLGLATLLWFVIAGEKTSEMGVSAPLELQNFPMDLEVTGEPVDNVEVRLRASPGIIQRIGPGDVSAQLDLAGLQEGEHIVHLTDKSIRMPFGVKVVKITPSILTLSLERTVQKVVPVRPRLVGRPAGGTPPREPGRDRRSRSRPRRPPREGGLPAVGHRASDSPRPQGHVEHGGAAQQRRRARGVSGGPRMPIVLTHECPP